MDKRPIGVFDSGIGGLSILQELQKRLPHESFVFFADQKNVPYGEKTKEELIELTMRIVKFLTDQNAKAVVAACNTATCYSIEELRKAYSLPIIGVVPAIKLAAEHTKTGNIGLIATPATAKSPYVTELIEQYASKVNVARIGCFGLENVVETGSLDGEEAAALLNKYIAPLKEQHVDQLVLGCTHYPFLKKQIGEILGPATTLVDSGEAVARRLDNVLEEKGLKNDEGPASETFFTNKDAADFSRVAETLLGHPVQAQYISL